MQVTVIILCSSWVQESVKKWVLLKLFYNVLRVTILSLVLGPLFPQILKTYLLHTTPKVYPNEATQHTYILSRICHTLMNCHKIII